MKIAVIGAGASGMVSALQAAWQGAGVCLLERNPVVGRKLLVTGSGRCNLTNAAVAAERYACSDPAWLDALFRRFGVADLLAMLGSIGIPVQNTADGWYYPLSNSAQSVVEAFSSALERAGVALSLQTQVTGLRSCAGGLALRFIAAGREEEQEYERVIVAAGGAAYPALGSRGELFPLLERLGHSCLPNRPALAPILAELGKFRPLQGVRLNAGVTLWDGSQRLGSTAGNLIFTEWGVNGPAVMDLSHLVTTRPAAGLTLSLNLLAFFPQEFEQLLSGQRAGSMPLRVFLDAFFPPKVSALFLKNAGLAEEAPLGQVEERALQRLLGMLGDLRFPVRGVRDFDYCQVSAGGVPVTEVEPESLASRHVPGLFLCGETLDVVGPCGGFNLQFAFSSGALAGRAAALA